jgi:hypothetical protein
MTMLRRVPGCVRGRAWVALAAVLAVPLAGCTTTPPEPAATGPAHGHDAAAPGLPALPPATPPTLAGRAAAAPDDDNTTLSCPPEPERSEEWRLTEVVVVVQGCLAFAEPLLTINAPDDAQVRFDVRPGARHVLVLFHLHAADRVEGTLEGPWPFRREGRSDEGTTDRDSLFRYDVPNPPPGSWKLQAWIDDLAVARTYTATVVVTY